jgi:hypothetical protein
LVLFSAAAFLSSAAIKRDSVPRVSSLLSLVLFDASVSRCLGISSIRICCLGVGLGSGGRKRLGLELVFFGLTIGSGRENGGANDGAALT